MITQNEIHRLVSLDGKVGYNVSAKREFKRLGLKLANSLRDELNLLTGADVRYNAGGIAVSGDVTLQADDVYVQFNADKILGILVRTCKGRRDYVGGRNRLYSFAQLEKGGVAGLAEFVQHVRQEVR